MLTQIIDDNDSYYDQNII